jgi:prepilin-type N-terminal cleavage/methylation domain-containing protein
MKEHTQNGFTITELIVTIVLLGIFATGISVGITSLGTINDRAREVADVDMTVENKIESLRSQHFTNLPLGGPVNFASELPDTVTSPRTASYTISSVNADLKKVNVIVSYNDRGTTRTFEYTTYIGKSGVGQ